MSGGEWKERKWSRQKWKELGDGTGRQRFEKSHTWHFTETSDAYKANYDLINWSNSSDDDNERPTQESEVSGDSAQ